MAQTTDKSAASAPPDLRKVMIQNPNPLIQGGAAETLAATRDYVADIASSFSMDDQVERGRWLRVMVVLHALDAVITENLYHR